MVRLCACLPAIALATGLAATTVSLRADDPMATLNRAIQERFQEIDERFGARRMVNLGATPHRFEPERVSEFEAVEELRQARLRVAMYLAGRHVLAPNSNADPARVFPSSRRVTFGPVAVTDRDASGLPSAADLVDESRVAFRELETRERYDFELGSWQFTARAIRASSNDCLTCHRGREIGDALGVVIYAYQPAR